LNALVERAIAIQAAAADADAVDVSVEETDSTFGRLDVLLSNAGRAIPKTFEKTTFEEREHKASFRSPNIDNSIR